MNGLMIIALLIFTVLTVLPPSGHGYPTADSGENELDNAIEPNKSRKAPRTDWIKLTKPLPQKITQIWGQIVEVKCEIMGSPAPSIEWFTGPYPSDNQVS